MKSLLIVFLFSGFAYAKKPVCKSYLVLANYFQELTLEHQKEILRAKEQVKEAKEDHADFQELIRIHQKFSKRWEAEALRAKEQSKEPHSKKWKHYYKKEAKYYQKYAEEFQKQAEKYQEWIKESSKLVNSSQYHAQWTKKHANELKEKIKENQAKALLDPYCKEIDYEKYAKYYQNEEEFWKTRAKKTKDEMKQGYTYTWADVPLKHYYKEDQDRAERYKKLADHFKKKAEEKTNTKNL